MVVGAEAGFDVCEGAVGGVVVQCWEPVVAVVFDRTHVVAGGFLGVGVGPGCGEGGGAVDVVDVVAWRDA